MKNKRIHEKNIEKDDIPMKLLRNHSMKKNSMKRQEYLKKEKSCSNTKGIYLYNKRIQTEATESPFSNERIKNETSPKKQ